jgi:hypothetical protein
MRIFNEAIFPNQGKLMKNILIETAAIQGVDVG